MKRVSAFLAFLLTVTMAAAATAAPYTSKTTSLKNNLEVKGSLSVGVPQTIANVNNAVKASEFDVNLTGNTSSSTTYRWVLPLGRACILNRVTIALNTAPAGGTCTLAVKKNNGNTMLSAATFDVTTVAANVASAPALSAVAADLSLGANDTVTVELVTGTLSTQAASPGITLEFIPNADF